MNIKEKLEYWGYKLFLSYDTGIQYEFNKEKNFLENASYFSKLKLLLKIILKVKVFGIFEVDTWNKKQRNLFYPEWDCPVADIYDGICDKIQKHSIIFADCEDVMMWPVLGNNFLQEDFKKNVKEITNPIIANTWLIDVLRQAAVNKVYIVYASELERISAEQINETCGMNKFQLCHVNDLEEIFHRYAEESVSERLLYIKSHQNGSKNEVFDTCKYPEILEKGKPYRPYSGYSPVKQIYNCVLSAKFQRGDTMHLNFFYGMGYKYGGILVAAICQWLNEICKLHDIGRIVFLARDCDIINKVYSKWFAQVDSVYVHTSRRALSEAMFCESVKVYLDHVIVPKMTYEKKVTIGSVLDDLGLGDLKQYLQDIGLQETQRLDISVYSKLERLLTIHQSDIEQFFLPYREAALKYITEIFHEKKRYLVLDVGWKGTVYRFLKIWRNELNLPGEIEGALIAGADNVAVANLVSVGEMSTYLFSNERMQQYKKKRGIPFNDQQVKCFETMFSSPEASLTHYQTDQDGKVTFLCRDRNANSENIEKIHEGVMDFLNDFLPYIVPNNFRISVEDAYEPFSNFLDNSRMVKLFIEHLNLGSK